MDYRRLVSELNWIECGVRPVVPLVVPVEPVVWTRSTPARQDVAKQKQIHNAEKSKQVFPEKELRGAASVPIFYIHVSVSDLNISKISLSILLQENMWTPILAIYKSLTDT